MRGYAAVGLDNPKHDVNVGSALRAAGCYRASLVVVATRRRVRSKIRTDTQCQIRHTPLIVTHDVFDGCPHSCVPVAIELIETATSLTEYQHPERAFYVFGSEDATLGARILDRCRDVVYVPTAYSMNLAATVNVVLYDRLAKRGR